MKFQVLTIFPELFEPFSKLGMFGRAVSSGRVGLETKHLRDYAINTQGQIDDTPYGGGSGMVLRAEPAVAAIREARSKDPAAKTVLFTPRGKPLTRSLAKQLAADCEKNAGGLILLCCRYEGVDERVIDKHIDCEISLGDYVLMGGEVAAMALMETTTRFVPGVLGNPDSLLEESFEHHLLEYPQYTKPREFEGDSVPDVLVSGDHARISEWRADKSLEITAKRRPDLLSAAELDTPPIAGELSVALMHHPVLNKEGKVITSSITNLDLPDIARSARTFGLAQYYVVHPARTLRRLMAKICEHWSEGYGLTYNPNRTEALERISLLPNFDDVLIDIEQRTGKLPKIITTSAKRDSSTISYDQMRSILALNDEPHLLILGTGWGLSDEFMARGDYRLEPVEGWTNYNHLSVRAAAAIMFDRLLGVHQKS